MCEFHGSNGNGLGDIWWTDKLIYFSIRPIDDIVLWLIIDVLNIAAFSY